MALGLSASKAPIAPGVPNCRCTCQGLGFRALLQIPLKSQECSFIEFLASTLISGTRRACSTDDGRPAEKANGVGPYDDKTSTIHSKNNSMSIVIKIVIILHLLGFQELRRGSGPKP